MPAFCAECGLAFEVDPHEPGPQCEACGGPLELVSVEDVTGGVDELDEVDLEAAELAALAERERLLGDVLAVFDHAGLAGLSAAVEQLDGDAVRDCLFVAVVQLAETDALADLAGMN